MLIRQMMKEDLKQVTKLESELFTSPWSYQDFESELTNNVFGHYFVLEDIQIIGYVGMNVMYEQSEITTIGVDSTYQGKGLGKQLLQYAIEYACLKECESMSLEVRQSNQVAINLYSSFQFEKKAIRKNYYQDNHEDAYLMIKELGG